MPETTFSKHLRAKLDAFQWDRFENWVSPGTPDLCGVLPNGLEVWVETKWTEGRRVKFREGQIPWQVRRYNAGSNVWTVVKYEGKKSQSILVYNPGQLVRLASHGVFDCPNDLALSGPFNKTAWNTLEYLLGSPQPRGLAAPPRGAARNP